MWYFDPDSREVIYDVNEASCDRCCFYDVCAERELCDDYSAAEAWADDEYIDALIEQGREEFRKEWFGYLEDGNMD